MELYELTEREKTVLRYVIHQFVLTANPVGSRNISKKYNIGYSPATIRNVMSDLEDSGLLGQPHTSAGRIPTDRGYRFYVDSLMDPPKLTKKVQKFVEVNIDPIKSETDELIKITSQILSEITNQIACVTYPKFENSILEKIQIVQLSSNRILVVVAIKSGLVRTITLELTTSIEFKNLQHVQNILNDRLSGLQFSEIKETFAARLQDLNKEKLKPIIRVFVDSIDKIFSDNRLEDKAIISGTKNILKQPEFEEFENIQGIIELVEDKDVIIHFMEKKSSEHPGEISITIGKENIDEKLSDYSMILRDYKIGEATGTVGVIGPKRMQYSKVLASVMYVTEALTKQLRA
ncbi:MAG: heat-inducible transcriptional repressor HrcA [Bacteroidetes bacterium]|nr:heat-inducible transcriptional repressor HrcA [Bacteroidota bacterium]MBU1680812.1 heat-inducible transcriptional repressor HrcA [Bacteroidota bacterium]MBU2506471.1 heat-inducible transcriptional repressor HrcA [Bacteroidota bacterium]